MKYRHAFHAGNFADVHKHVTLLALLAALTRKDGGLLYLETHAGRGAYDLSSPAPEAAAGIVRFLAAQHAEPELRAYADLVRALRERSGRRHLYPGSPLIAQAALRSQDRVVLYELQGAEAHALGAALEGCALATGPRVRVERADGYAGLRAHLPPKERRGLVLVDPPYEETRADAERVIAALAEGLRRFPTGVIAAWYPIKKESEADAWQARCARAAGVPLLVSELWLYPRDSRVGLNGSGLVIANPPWQVLERMQAWLPRLEHCLAVGAGGGSRARMLSESRA